MTIDKNSYGTIAIAVIAAAAIVTVSLLYIRAHAVSYTIAVIASLFAAFVVCFHRVPRRTVPDGDNLVTSGADGRVVIISKVFEGEYLKRECMQVSVYMDFFNVHANFWPVGGKVTYYKYHPGKYLLAFLPKAAEENEHSSTAIDTGRGEVFFKQIAGTFARRIVCYSEEGCTERRGEQCGIIKFGSRFDIFLPLDAEIKVRLGQEIRAAETVVAILK